MAISKIDSDGIVSGGITADSLDIGQIGGRRNLIINGAMQVAQRGTSVSVGSGTYTLDRWSTDRDGTVTATVSQQSFTLGQTDVPNEPQNYLRFDVTAASGGSYLNLRHFIENVRNGAGQTVTLSFWAKADASRTLNLRYQQYCGSGGSSISPVSLTAKNLTTSWQKFTETFTLASLSGKTVSGGNDSLRILFDLPVNTVETFDFANVQLEVGSVATPFEHRSYGEELAACQRYFVKSNAGEAANEPIGNGLGHAENTTRVDLWWNFPVELRAAPTVTLKNNFIFRENGSNRTVTSVSVSPSAKDRAWILGTTSGHTDEATGQVYTNGTNVALTADAEL